MGMLMRTAVVATLGVVAWKAWQWRRAAGMPGAVPDEGGLTPPHGDPRVPAVDETELATEPRVAAQSSRGFGEV